MITYHNIEVEKYKFYQHKNPILIYDVNIDRIVASNKVLFVKKVLNFYWVVKMILKKIMPLCIILPKMSTERKIFDEIKYVFFDRKI